MNPFFNRWTRKLHRWGAILIAIPLLLVIITGLLLQLKKHVAWIQPRTTKGSSTIPRIGWDTLLEACRGDANANIRSWEDVNRLDVRPSDGIVKVQARNQWELQIDLDNAAVLSSTYRRSDLIETLHDGTFFSDFAKIWIFLPNGVVLLGLWLTGIYLWYIPFAARRRQARKKAKIAAREIRGGE